jgi:hypothetical protein
MNRIAALIVDESKWMPVSMGLAVLAVIILLYRGRGTALPLRHRVAAALNLYFGVTIGTMAFGHLLAVTAKLALGTLEGSVTVLYLIGVAIAVPSWWMIGHTRLMMASGDGHERRTLALNAWLAITLLALGPHNLPLAAPALFNIAYQKHSRPAVGWAIVSLAVVVGVTLFVGSMIFFMSGQTFEQFQGIE